MRSDKKVIVYRQEDNKIDLTWRHYMLETDEKQTNQKSK